MRLLGIKQRSSEAVVQRSTWVMVCSGQVSPDKNSAGPCSATGRKRPGPPMPSPRLGIGNSVSGCCIEAGSEIEFVRTELLVATYGEYRSCEDVSGRHPRNLCAVVLAVFHASSGGMAVDIGAGEPTQFVPAGFWPHQPISKKLCSNPPWRPSPQPLLSRPVRKIRKPVRNQTVNQRRRLEPKPLKSITTRRLRLRERRQARPKL